MFNSNKPLVQSGGNRYSILTERVAFLCVSDVTYRQSFLNIPPTSISTFHIFMTFLNCTNIIIEHVLPFLLINITCGIYVGLNFIFFCFKLIIYHTSPYPRTYLPWQHGKLPVKESRDAILGCRSWRLSMFHFLPPLDCQQPHYLHPPPPPPPCLQIDPAALGNYVKSGVKLSHFRPYAWRFRKEDGWLASQGFCIPRISIILGDPRISICFSKYYIFWWAVLKRGGQPLNPPLPDPNSYTCATKAIIVDEWRK